MEFTEMKNKNPNIQGAFLLANCPAVFLSYFHCGFVMKYKAGKYKDHNEQYKSAEWVGQFTTFLSAPPPPPLAHG